jgi:hypothetical protein
MAAQHDRNTWLRLNTMLDTARERFNKAKPLGTVFD